MSEKRVFLVVQGAPCKQVVFRGGESGAAVASLYGMINVPQNKVLSRQLFLCSLFSEMYQSSALLGFIFWCKVWPFRSNVSTPQASQDH